MTSFFKLFDYADDNCLLSHWDMDPSQMVLVLEREKVRVCVFMNNLETQLFQHQDQL